MPEPLFKIEKVVSKDVACRSRSWNRQSIKKYLMRYPVPDDNGNSDSIIEAMLIRHYKDSEIRDVTIEVSNMYNCVVGCAFCASGSLPGEVVRLKAQDYLKQIETILDDSKVNPDDFPRFVVSFSGIGEPSVVCEEIADAITGLREKYPGVKIIIATFGLNSNCFDYWSNQNLPIITLQLPYYSYDNEKLKTIVRNIPQGYDLIQNLNKALQYRNRHNECRIKLNYIVMKDFNDSDEDVDAFIKYLETFKKDITVKLSFLNYTTTAERNHICSSSEDRIATIDRRLKSAGYDTYIFGTSENYGLGCGQLVQDNISGIEGNNKSQDFGKEE